MSRYLATLPWVEIRTIEAEGSSRTVTFGINDADAWNLDEVKKVLTSRYDSGVSVVKGPDPVAKAPDPDE